MIGIIITGHANFATGMLSSLNLITGIPAQCYGVDFLEGQSAEDLSQGIEEAINKLKQEDCSDILVFSDLVGGSPFKTAVEVKMRRSERIEVLSGSNLGMLIEASMARAFVEDLDALIEMALNTGKTQVMKYTYTERVEQECEDGI